VFSYLLCFPFWFWRFLPPTKPNLSDRDEELQTDFSAVFAVMVVAGVSMLPAIGTTTTGPVVAASEPSR
jgi:hypothetical protein